MNNKSLKTKSDDGIAPPSTRIFIATPCYGGMLTTNYFESCMGLMAQCIQKRIGLQFATIGNESLVTRARNTLVQLFMDDKKEYTHLMFIDADIGFEPLRRAKGSVMLALFCFPPRQSIPAPS